MVATLWEEKLKAADDSEVHWSASTVMSVFMAASLVSAVFFGLGYSFGRGGAATVLKAMPMVSSIASEHVGEPTSSKPAASQVLAVTPASSPHSADVQNKITVPAPNALQAAAKMPTVYAPLHVLPSVVAAHKRSAAVMPEHVATKRNGAKASSAPHYMVQVGAVGDRKDARMLVTQLRKHGFHAGIYSAKSDRFLHVQIGPFANAEQAQTMRHHVMASGYRAILKHAS